MKRANLNVACEEGAVAQVRINSVPIERKKFSEVCGVFRVLYSSSRLFSIIFVFLTRRKCTADGKRKLVGRSSKETGLKSVYSTYCVPRNILIFTGFSSTALLTCS